MFTGIVEQLGELHRLEALPAGKKLVIRSDWDTREIDIGASIAINGCCLTVVDRDSKWLVFEAGEETLSRTNLGELKPGSLVNLERGMQLGDRIDGHLVSGHIDGVGRLIARRDDHDWSDFRVEVSPDLARQMAAKGSVAVDGVSLTLVEVGDDFFTVALIPHTLQQTNLGGRAVGDPLNIETDLLAKYIQRQLSGQSGAKAPGKSRID